MLTMTNRIRLHLASIAPVADNFDQLFLQAQTLAQTLLDGGLATDSTMWEVAQYVDLADAGFGSKRTVLYRRAKNALSAYVRSHLDKPASRSMFGRSAALAELVERALNDEVTAIDEAQKPRAQVVVLAA